MFSIYFIVVRKKLKNSIVFILGCINFFGLISTERYGTHELREKRKQDYKSTVPLSLHFSHPFSRGNMS